MLGHDSALRCGSEHRRCSALDVGADRCGTARASLTEEQDGFAGLMNASPYGPRCRCVGWSSIRSTASPIHGSPQLDDDRPRLAAACRLECRANRLAELRELAHAEDSFDNRANDCALIECLMTKP